MSNAVLVAVVSATIHICVFVSWCCHTPKMSHRQKLFSILLLEVLIFNFIGKCIVSLVFINVLDENHIGNCRLIGFMQLFADNGGLYGLSIALMVSFAPHIPLFKKLVQVIDNKNILQIRKHMCLCCFIIIITSIPFFFDAFGHDEYRCHVSNQWVLMIFYRVEVYLSGSFFFCCSIYIWIKKFCLNEFNKKEKCKNFITLIVFPAFFIAFSLPFEIQDICKILGYTNHTWDNFSILWGHIFGPAVGIISLASFWQNTIHRKMHNYLISATETIPATTTTSTELTDIQFNHSHLSSHVHLSQGTVNLETELSQPITNKKSILLKIATDNENQSLSDKENNDLIINEKPSDDIDIINNDNFTNNIFSQTLLLFNLILDDAIQNMEFEPELLPNYLCTDKAKTCPKGQENNSNASNNTNHGNDNNSNSNNQNNNININNNWQNNKKNNKDEDEKKKQHNYTKRNDHPSFVNCNHLNECKSCAYILDGKYEEIKIFKDLIFTLQEQHEYHQIFEKMIILAKLSKASKIKLKKKTKKSAVAHSGKCNIKITKMLTDTIIPNKVKSPPSNVFHYLHKSIDMQYNDKQIDISDNNDSDFQIINVDFYDKKSGCLLFCVAKKKKEYNLWTLDDKLYTKNELIQLQNSKQLSMMGLPQSSRDRMNFLHEMKEINEVLYDEDRIKKMLNYKKNVCIYNNQKNNNYQTQRITLVIKQKELNSIIQTALKKSKNHNLIPILMLDNNNNTHWVEYIFIVAIQHNIDVGISLRFNKENCLRITGIHLDKHMILQQYELLSPHKCDYLNDFKSPIQNMIVGDPGILFNKIKNYKQKYTNLKAFICKFTNETLENISQCKELQKEAEIFIDDDNGELAKSLSSVNINTIQSYVRTVSITSPVSTSLSLPFNYSITDNK